MHSIGTEAPDIVNLRNLAIAAFSLALAGAAALAGTAAPARGDTTPALRDVLAQVRNLAPNDFFTLACWSRDGELRAPRFANVEPQEVENDIVHLTRHDQDAIVAWLQGKGRASLYAQGASDGDIGAPRPEVDPPAPSPTPNPWRDLPLASATLVSSTQEEIQITGGFAAAKRDGTSAIACVSFKNVHPVAAKRVLFEFPLLNVNGSELAKLALDRTGEFSPGIAIQSFDSIDTWQGGASGPVKSFLQSCTRLDLPTPAMPLFQARLAGYRVVRVEYVDGTAVNAPVEAPK